MKQIFQKGVFFVRKSISRLFFLSAILMALQIAQFHELYEKIGYLQTSSHLHETPAVSVEQEQIETISSPKISPKEVHSFSDSLIVYAQEWEKLISLSFWNSPKEFYDKLDSQLYLQTFTNFYPAIALTPLSVVYAVYGYALALLVSLFLKFVGRLFFKNRKELPEKANNE